jgi:hypothetical protein
MTIHQDNFAELVDLDPVLTEIFFESYNKTRSPLWSIVKRRPMSAAKVTDLKLGSFGDPVPLVGKVQYETPKKDFDIEYIPLEYAKGFSVTKFMLSTLQYDTAFDSAEALGTSFMRFEDKSLANVLNNSTTTLGYDGKALCANDHPRSSSDSTAVDNLLEVALTADSLTTAINTLEALGTNNADETENGSVANLLIYGRGSRKKAKELIDSELTPESGNNAINVNAGMTGLYEPRLTGNSWYVADSAMMAQYLKWYDLTTTEFAAQEDFNTLERQFRAYCAFVVGWSDFRWVVAGKTS